MAKGCAIQINIIGEHVARLAGEQAREQVMAGSEAITASSSPAKVACWVQGAMARLDALVDEETRRRIMGDCGRNCALAHQGTIDRRKAQRRRYATEDAFLEAEQRNPAVGMRLVREGDVVYQFYTPHDYRHPMRCYCSLTRGLPEGETASLTFCECSRGFVQETWEQILGRPVRVEVLESAVSGARECKFAIYL